jgi:hypothetical protein
MFAKHMLVCWFVDQNVKLAKLPNQPYNQLRNTLTLAKPNLPKPAKPTKPNLPNQPNQPN